MPEVLQAVRTARGRFAMAGLYSGPLKGLLAWSSKMSFIGRVGGLREGLEGAAVAEEEEGGDAAGDDAEDWAGEEAALVCARLLATAVRKRLPPRALADAYMEAAAALALAPGCLAARQLLRLLCWVPTKRFSARLMEVAAVCWHWVMAAGGPETQLALLGEVTDAWLFSMRAGLGLFSHSLAPPMLASASTATPAPAGAANGITPAAGMNGLRTAGLGEGWGSEEGTGLDGVRAHHLWIRFFWEVGGSHQYQNLILFWVCACLTSALRPLALGHRADAMEERPCGVNTRQAIPLCSHAPPARPQVGETLRHDLSSTQAAAAQIYTRLLEETLQDPSAFSGHAATAGARFRLLALALQFCQVQQADAALAAPGKPCPPSVALLYERVLQVGLVWFAEPLGWHDADKAAAKEAAAATRDFLGRVQRVRRWPAYEGGGPSGKPHPVWGDAPEGASAAATDNAQRQALLVLLLEVEAERLGTWAEPLGTGSMAAAAAAAAASSAAAAVTSSQWVQHVRVAWAVSPRLALALRDRFPAAEAVRSELARAVAEGAADPALQALPEAVTLIATQAAAAADAPQLAYMAVWAPLPLQEAMPLLSSPAGRHPTVLDYLLRSLLSCPPEDVAFFLPQLVQLLRFDQRQGLVERYLLDAASRSVYFAHLLACQLASEGTPPDDAFNPTVGCGGGCGAGPCSIMCRSQVHQPSWSTVQVKRSGWTPPSDTGLWAIADRVHTRLLDELHGPVAERLRAELGYFEEVTAVSGKLYPIPKEERKTAAAKFLVDLATPPRPDLYIPTNPDCRVLALVPESAAPMQVGGWLGWWWQLPRRPPARICCSAGRWARARPSPHCLAWPGHWLLMLSAELPHSTLRHLPRDCRHCLSPPLHLRSPPPSAPSWWPSGWSRPPRPPATAAPRCRWRRCRPASSRSGTTAARTCWRCRWVRPRLWGHRT